jgi:hypothetical protein
MSSVEYCPCIIRRIQLINAALVNPKNSSGCDETPAHASTLRPAHGQHERLLEVLTKLVKCPFTLSRLRSGRVEGWRTDQLPF